MSTLRTFSDLADVLATIDVPVVLVAQRTDGFGERMKAILIGLTLSDILGRPFKFRWQVRNLPFDQGMPPQEEVFDEAFIAEYSLDESRIGDAKLVRFADLWQGNYDRALQQARRQGVFYLDIPQNLSSAQLDPGPPADWLRRVSGNAAKVGYAPMLALARAEAEKVNLGAQEGGLPAAIHLRAGDMVYGDYRMRDRLHFKCCPYPLAKYLADKERQQGRQAILFGQDKAVLAFLKSACGALSARDFVDAYDFDPMQEIVFEIALMSRCREIYAGSSGFATLASWTGQLRHTLVRNLARRDNLAPVIEAEVVSDSASQVPPLQVAFAARWAMLLRNEPYPVSEASIRMLEVCRQYDPDNILFAFIHACFLQRQQEGTVVVPEIAAFFEKGRFDPVLLVRLFSPRHDPVLPPECLETMAALAKQNVPGAVFAEGLRHVLSGRSGMAKVLCERLAGADAEHLHALLADQIAASAAS